MILAMIGDRTTIAWERGTLDVIEATETQEARIRRAFSKPARARRSVVVDGGGIEERLEKVAPGSADHARAVIYAMKDSRILLDNEGG